MSSAGSEHRRPLDTDRVQPPISRLLEVAYDLDRWGYRTHAKELREFVDSLRKTAHSVDMRSGRL